MCLSAVYCKLLKVCSWYSHSEITIKASFFFFYELLGLLLKSLPFWFGFFWCFGFFFLAQVFILMALISGFQCSGLLYCAAELDTVFQ